MAGMFARPPLVVPVVALVTFVTLAVLVAVDWRPIDRLDATLSEDLRGFGTDRPRLVEVLRIATDIGATIPFVAAGVIATVGLLLRRHRRAAYLCGWVTVLIPAIWGIMHATLHRPRPLDGFVFVDSNGFPSGHTSHAASAALVAVLLLWPHLARRGRVLLAAGAVGLALFVGATRVMLLAHWPSDVVGGWLLALAVVPLTARVVTARQTNHARE